MKNAPRFDPILKACPFCGSAAKYENHTQIQPFEHWVATCPQYCATSPECDSKREAAEWWNMRKRAQL